MHRSFGKTRDGREAMLYIIRNSRGMEAAVTNYGAALVELKVPDREGNIRDVVVGYGQVSGYETNGGSVGGTVGRFANRIGKGRFTIGGKEYQLTTNNGPNTLHGGRDFFIRRHWTLEKEEDHSVTFFLHSEDGDQGFPGNTDIRVTYTVMEEQELQIDYKACSDADTPLNLTNHSYFNAAGHDSGSVLDQLVAVEADKYTETDEFSLPTGRLIQVAGTPMDFRVPKALGKDIGKDYYALAYGSGYDHNYAIRGEGYRKAAELYCPESGILMTVKTDLPGLQLYSANHLGPVEGKGGVIYKPRHAVCFETQYYPDAINNENFPGGLLKAGREFNSTTAYAFSVKSLRAGSRN
jgi:aldose 1-epimerase